MIYLFTVLYFTALVFYQRSQFRDLKYKRNTEWKTWANVMKGLFFGQFLIPINITWQDVLLVWSITSIQFEIMYNLIVLKTYMFYNGTTSKFDKLGNWKWIILIAFLIIATFLKLKT